MPVDYVECPSSFSKPSIFLAGGITGCENWQVQMVNLLAGTNLILVNPRRENFDIGDSGKTLQQIEWEHLMLRRCDGILFWFSKETIQPIVLFELGAHLQTVGKPIFIGMNPEYQRRVDVEVQTKLVRPDLQIVYSLQALAGQVIAWESVFNQGLLGNPDKS